MKTHITNTTKKLQTLLSKYNSGIVSLEKRIPELEKEFQVNLINDRKDELMKTQITSFRDVLYERKRFVSELEDILKDINVT